MYIMLFLFLLKLMVYKLLLLFLCHKIAYQSPPLIKKIHFEYLLSRGMYCSFFNVSEHPIIFNYDLTQDTTFTSSIGITSPLPRFRKTLNETTEICPFNNNKCNIAYKFTDMLTFNYYSYKSNIKKTFIKTVFPIFRFDDIENQHAFDVIGLNYKPQNSDNNFLSNLKGIISNKNFGFSKINKISNRGNVTFGGLEEFSSYKESCKVNRTFSFWGCDLQGIQFTNTNNNKLLFYNTKYYSFFQVNQTQMTAPIEFIDKVIKPAFIEKLLKDGTCKSYVFKFIKRYMCRCNSIKSMPNITLFFKGAKFGIDIPLEQLFEEYGDECKFLIEGSLYKDFNHIIIGSSLFNHLDTFFDARNGIVWFYNNIPFKTTIGRIVNDIHSQTVNVISLINFTMQLLIIFIVHLVLIYIKLHKIIN